MLPTLALLLGLGVAQGARPIKRSFQSFDDLVEVSPDELAALGGEADCPVHVDFDAAGRLVRLRVGACPAGVIDQVQKAAESWTADAGGGGLLLVGIIKVRSPEVLLRDPGVLDVNHRAVTTTRRVKPRHAFRTWKAIGLLEISAEATCVVQLVVDEKGRPESSNLSNCPAAFREQSQRAVMRWRFKPLLLEGEAVRSSFRITLRYLSM